MIPSKAVRERELVIVTGPTGLELRGLLTVSKHESTKLPFLSHDIKDENPLLILTIKNATGWNH
jgi:hypothetical protein